MMKSLLCVLFLLIHGNALAANDAGFVLKIHGTWSIKQTARKIQVGDRIEEGAIISAPTTVKKDDAITIALRDSRRLSFNANTPVSTLEEPIRLAQVTSVGERIWEAVLQLFSSNHQRYTHATQRGNKKSSYPQSGVVLLKQGKLDLAPLFATLPAKSYTISIDGPMSLNSEKPVSGKPVIFAWSPNSPSLVPFPRPFGLYKLFLYDEDGKVISDTVVWVFIASPERYMECSKAYQEAVELSTSWNDQDATVIYLRAYLEALANPKK